VILVGGGERWTKLAIAGNSCRGLVCEIRVHLPHRMLALLVVEHDEQQVRREAISTLDRFFFEFNQL
jgi:hypothetical protein